MRYGCFSLIKWLINLILPASIVLAFTFLAPGHAHSDTVVVQPPTVEQMIETAAAKYSVNVDRLRSTLDCESLHFTNFGQSKIPHVGGPNGYEDSWGIAQIHEPGEKGGDHPEVSMEQALDPAFAIDWTAQQFSTGHARMWTCWRNLYK